MNLFEQATAPKAEYICIPVDSKYNTASIVCRFLSKVQTAKGDKCWTWLGAHVPKGYGIFCVTRKERYYAHRFSLMLFSEVEIANGLVVMHSCDNPSCVNPKHLAVGTQKENMQDASRKGRTRNVSDWSGQGNPKAKLTAEQIAEIPQLLRQGKSRRELSEAFCVSTTRIGQISKAYYIAHSRTGGGWNEEVIA